MPGATAAQVPERAAESMASDAYIHLVEEHGAHNYHPLPVVISSAEGSWVTDPEGRRYLDMLSSYSAINQGHRHPRIIAALKAQADRVTLTSRAFHNEQLGPFLKQLCDLSGFDRVLPMNTGAEAVETGLKACRKWAYTVKGVPDGQAEIIVAAGNFHGRTTTIISFSTEAQYRAGFGPFTPGFKVVPFGDIDALRAAITPNTAAFLVEPIQAEGGILMPPPGYLEAARALCTERNVLLFFDEIQTGLARTGRMFCFEHHGLRPDCVSLGKALGGGVYPVSAFLADEALMGVFHPGDHGSTFGGNPLAAAVARASLDVLVEERLDERSAALGAHAMARLRAIKAPQIVDVRGRGLLIGLELDRRARPTCERLMRRGVLCKETHDNVIRFAPPLTINQADLDWGFDQIEAVLTSEADA